jgi:hypothetical protein
MTRKFLLINFIVLLISYGFFEFENEQMAQEAVKQTDGYRLDKNHTFSVSLMSEFDRYDKNRLKSITSNFVFFLD